MADWIKVEITSSQKIEVLTIADILDMDEHMVFGKLVILWCWADANTVDGHADNVTKRMIDRVVSHQGFADAMLDERVGWLLEDKKGSLSFSNFDRHNGKGAKKRATDARRKANHRAAITNKSEPCHDDSVTESVTREEKKRKEEIREENINSAFESFWDSGMVKKNKSGAKKSFKAKLKSLCMEPDELSELMIKDVKERISSGQFGFDKMHPQTYINGERWNDDKQKPEQEQIFEKPSWMRGVR